MHRLKVCCLLVAIIVMTACSNTSLPTGIGEKSESLKIVSTPEKLASSTATPMLTVATGSSSVKACGRELRALEKIDPTRHAKRRVQFDRLMEGAARYSGIRVDLPESTRTAVDAMYRYQTEVLCAEISRDVLEGLVKLKI
ncbi:hypothetical protein GC910_21960, partial [Salmonella enterica]|nr:hypothetical protein [Salmonella enterica]